MIVGSFAVESRPQAAGLSVAGLFAGIGGIEVGLTQAGHKTVLLCDNEPTSQDVLRGALPGRRPRRRRPRARRASRPSTSWRPGFPCQDLSQAGRTAGIGGEHSGLVARCSGSCDDSDSAWLLLENVPFMLQLDRGEAMRYLTRSLEELEFRWAYRVVDTRAFGLPQRRQRVILLASRTEDPATVLFAGDAGEPSTPDGRPSRLRLLLDGGRRGLGWAVDAVPTLKGGSTIGIPSPPAIRLPDGSIGRPEIRDAERLQGFDPDWTLPRPELAATRGRPLEARRQRGERPCRAVGGRAPARPRAYDDERRRRTRSGQRRVAAGSVGRGGKARRASLSAWPVREPYQHLDEFLEYDAAPLSAARDRASSDVPGIVAATSCPGS